MCRSVPPCNLILNADPPTCSAQAWFIEAQNILDPRHEDIAPKVLSLKAAGYKAAKELGAMT